MAENTGETDKKMEEFLTKTFDMIIHDATLKGTKRSTKVLDYKNPQQLMSSMDFEIGDSPASGDDILDLLRQTVVNSSQTAHPHYFNQLYAGRSAEGLAAACMVEALNTNVHTYESAPVFTLAEIQVVKKFCQLIGYKDGNGIFMGGGSLCNLMAMHLARFQRDKAVKQQGLFQSPRMAIFSSGQAHYSVMKGASFLGFGTDSVVEVATDDRGRMDPHKLDEAILRAKEQGMVPLFVMATSGTTVLGAFDPLDRLAEVCHRHDCWLHVDACWGGGVLYSDTHRHLLQGAEQTDSMCVSFHKLQGANIQCAALFTQDQGVLRECNTVSASYLFQTDKQYYDPSYDLGNLTVQCSRKADGFKLWLLWKARGNQGMQTVVDRAFDNARYFTEKIKETEGFQLIFPEFQYVNISFWYIPPSLRGQEQNQQWWQKIATVTPTIKERMVKSGSLAIGYQPLESFGFVNFFRIIIENPDITTADMDFVMQEIQRLGKDL